MARLLVNVYTRTDTRSKVLGAAMQRGIKAVGDFARLMPTIYYKSPDDADVAMFYAYKGRCKEIMADYLKAGKHVVYIDRGYFGTKPPGTDHYNGYHRFAIDALHPTPEDVMRASINWDRWKHHRIDPQKHYKGSHILLAGMSPNQARKAGLKANEWEIRTAKELRRVTKRTILYRPKPSWDGAPSVPGCVDAREKTLGQCLWRCHLTVSHHSNIAIDGLIAGVPGMVTDGPCRNICPEGGLIEEPFFPGKTFLTQFLSGLSYWQWNRDEMVDGTAWRFLKEQICMR